MQVPEIDMSQSEEAAAAQVRAACLGTGFFYGRAPQSVAGCKLSSSHTLCSVPSAVPLCKNLR